MRHKEYEHVFDRLIGHVKELKPDVSVITGDTGHTKVQISPEYVSMSANLFKRLADISPTKIILGNHDCLYKNKSRLDAISPIVESLAHPDLEVYLQSGEFPFDTDMVFNVMYTFDRDLWVPPSDQSKINIALYHGSVVGSNIDTGWTMEHADDTVDIFQPFDFALLGDIHKSNQILDDDGRCRYAGSLIQQNHGETDDKGFLVWDIESKDKFTVKHISIPNPKPFVSINLGKDGSPEEANIQPGSRLRIVSEHSLPIDTIRKTIDTIKNNLKPESVSFLNKATDKSAGVVIGGQFKKEDLRNLNVQEKLIKEYLADYTISADTFEKIYEINKKYNQEVQADDTSARNIEYEINSFEWDNLFKFGEGNKLDFGVLNGIVGIFGKNLSGKSSIIDGVLYTLFNSISKNYRKKSKIINTECDQASGHLTLKSGNKIYSIHRTSEKYVKKLKGVETIEAKTDLDFSVKDLATGETSSLNGIDRVETDRNIAKHFGTFDDFLLSSMSSQLGALSYIDKGSTERKEILAKFLDVDFFSKKFDLAKKEASSIKTAIKLLEGKDFDEEIKKLEYALDLNIVGTEKAEKENSALKLNAGTREKELVLLSREIDSSPNCLIDIDDILKKIAKNNSKTDDLRSNISSDKVKLAEKNKEIARLDAFIKSFDISALRNKKEVSSAMSDRMDNILNDINEGNKELSRDVKKVDILKDVPCGPEYSHCKFIKGAYEAKEHISVVTLVLDKKKEELSKLEDEIRVLDDSKTLEQISKYESIVATKRSLDGERPLISKNIEVSEQYLNVAAHELSNLNNTKKEFEENKEKIEALEGLVKQAKDKKAQLDSVNLELENCQALLKTFYKDRGFIEQKIESIKEDRSELEKIRQEFEAYDLFLKCMHSSGISYDIIKKSLPIINDEISKILANITEFQVYFENEDSRLEIYSKEDIDSQPLPIEMGSGAQKTIAAMAIRLALINISALPKADIFILDEPGTSLDEDMMSGFLRMLDVVKSQFKCVILISHIESLKDAADTTMSVENKDGYAYINC